MCVAALATVLSPGAAGSGWDRPFDGAEFVAADVDFFVHINEPASLRDRLARRGIDLGAGGAVPGAAMMDAWAALARSAGLSERQLFDDLFGQGVTFAFRRGQGDRIDWVAIATINDEMWADFTRRLDLRIGAPVHGIAIHALHEQELAFARLSPIVIAGPRVAAASGGLLAESLALVSGTANHSLARDEALAPAIKLGDGEIGLFARHAPPLGGSSVVVGDLGRDLFVARHASAFANSPFGESPRPSSIRRALFNALGEESVCVLAQPLEMPTGALAAFVRARLPQGALTPAVEENLGERLLWIVAERKAHAAEAAKGAAPLDLVLVIEVRDPSIATAQADALCGGLAQVITDLVLAADERVRPTLPDFAQQPPDAVRRIEIGPALAQLFPRLVDPKTVSLNWTTVNGSQGTWWVVGTGDQAVASIAATLIADLPIEGAMDDRAIDLDWQFGVARGPQAAAHIERLGDRLAALSPGGETNERGRVEKSAIEGITEFLASALGAVDRCYWKAELPGQNRVRSTWVFHFDKESPGPDDGDPRAVDRR